MRGIDVSYSQKNIDWKKVKEDGIEFAFIRTGYGRDISQKDAQFEAHYAGASEAGILLGGYHYSYALDVAGAKAEAAACLQMIQSKTFDLPIAYDLEEPKQYALSPSELYAMYQAFAQIIEAAGYKTMLYTNKNWLTTRWDKTNLSKDGAKIWMAQYNNQMTYNGKSTIHIWQNSSSENIDGIAGRVDTNILLCDIQDLKTMKSGWIQEADGRHWYQREDGSYPKDVWQHIDGKWYHFDADGYMQTGWIQDDGKWYYLKPDGSMASNEILGISSVVYGDEQYAFAIDGHMLTSTGRGALI